MINRFLYFRPEITKLLELAKQRGDIDQCKPVANEVSDDQWEVLGDIREILRTFEDPNLELQGSNCLTISFTIPHVFGILKKLDAVLFIPDSNNKDLKKRTPYFARGVREAQRKILDYYPIYDDNINSLKTLSLATALDPRLKLGVFEDIGFLATIIADVKTYFRDVYINYRLEHGWSENASQDCSETMITDEEASTQRSSLVKGFGSNLFFDKMRLEMISMKSTSTFQNVERGVRAA